MSDDSRSEKQEGPSKEGDIYSVIEPVSSPRTPLHRPTSTADETLLQIPHGPPSAPGSPVSTAQRTLSFTTSDFSPSKLPLVVRPRLALSVNFEELDRDWVVSLKSYVKTAVYHLINLLSEGLQIYKYANAQHYNNYDKIRNVASQTFESYRKFKDAALLDTDILEQSPLFLEVDLSILRCPRGSSQAVKTKMASLRAGCARQLADLAFARLFVEYTLRLIETASGQEAEDSGEDYEVLDSLPQVSCSELSDVAREVLDEQEGDVGVGSADEKTRGETLEEDNARLLTHTFKLLGIRDEKAKLFAEELCEYEIPLAPGEFLYGKLERFSSEHSGLYEGPNDYAKAAKDFGMDDIFCLAIGQEKDFWLVGAQRLWWWIMHRIDAADAAIQRDGELHLAKFDLTKNEEKPNPAEVPHAQAEQSIPTGSVAGSRTLRKGYGGTATVPVGLRRADQAETSTTVAGATASAGGEATGGVESTEGEESAVDIAIADRAKNPERYTALYYGHGKDKLNSFLHPDHGEEGKARDPRALRSWPRSDFHRSEALYFAVDRGMAEHYARQHRRNNGGILSVCILQVWIKKDHISHRKNIGGGRAWQEFVLCNRLGEKPGRHLKEYQSAEILEGETSGTPSQFMGSNKIEDIKPIRLPQGVGSTQICFRTLNSWLLLENVEASLEKLD